MHPTPPNDLETVASQNAGQKKKKKRTKSNLPNGHRLVHLRLATNTSFTRGRSTSASLTLKHLPELQALVRSSGGQELTVRTQRTVEDSSLMRRDFDVADQCRVAPDAQRVVWESTRADNLPVVVAPPQAGHLGASVDAVGTGAGGGIPEVYVTVIRTTSGGQQVQLPGAPAESLDGGAVVGLGELGGAERPGIPDVDQVVVTARRKLCAIRAPLQAADF